ncbi:MAG TPA: segregation/condensation protein A [Chthonomonadales bacterium]|nr:segregation/condensation protein A [Chthonomonadales bacterium]
MPTSAQRALQVRLPAFEGPLDLLLHLIRQQRVDIYDIPIARITEQYLDQLDVWRRTDLAIAGEYLVMAATLVEIKARMLLPKPPIDEDGASDADPRAELVERLLEYQRYEGPVEALRVWEGDRRMIYFRGAAENPDDYLLPIDTDALTPLALLEALRSVLASAGVSDSAITAVLPRRRVTLRMKMAEILRRVRAHSEGVSFSDLFDLPCAVHEIVLAFLALLELMRQRLVIARQRGPHADIIVHACEAST